MKQRVVLFVLFLLMLLVLSACNRDDVDVAVTTSTKQTTTRNLDSYWGSRLSAFEQEQKSTNTKKEKTIITKSETKMRRTTVTTEKKRTTAFCTSTTTSAMQSTTKRATVTLPQETKDMIYEMVYQRNLLEYYNRLQEQQKKKQQAFQIREEIDNLTEEATALYAQYQIDLDCLTEEIANKGLSGATGYYKEQTERLENQYKANVTPLNERIGGLNELLTEVEKDLDILIEEPTRESVLEEYLAEVEAYEKKLQ